MQAMETFPVTSPSPLAARPQRLDWRSASMAGAFTVAQFALLLLALQLRAVEPAPIEPLPVVLLPEPLPSPPPEKPEPPVVEPGVAGGSPAPEVARTLPLAPIVLTEPEPVTVAPVAIDLAPLGPALVTGEGGTGQGGTGEGTGNGSGEGSGGGSPAARPGRLVHLNWAPSMRFSRLQRYYPKPALGARLPGVARLDCEIIRGDRVRDCRLLAEAPAGHGFGAAALEAEEVYRLQLREKGGKRIYGERITLNAHFRPPPKRN